MNAHAIWYAGRIGRFPLLNCTTEERSMSRATAASSIVSLWRAIHALKSFGDMITTPIGGDGFLHIRAVSQKLKQVPHPARNNRHIVHSLTTIHHLVF